MKLRRYGTSVIFLAHDTNCFVDIWNAISGSAHPGKHDMACQARHTHVQARAECLIGDFLEVAHPYAYYGYQTQVTPRRWRCAPVATRVASWLCGMYARRTRDKRVRVLSAPAAFSRGAHRNHFADSRGSNIDPCGWTHRRAHAVQLHGELRKGALGQTSLLLTGR